MSKSEDPGSVRGRGSFKPVPRTFVGKVVVGSLSLDGETTNLVAAVAASASQFLKVVPGGVGVVVEGHT